MSRLRLWIASLALVATLFADTAAAAIEFLVHISVDGLRADAVTTLGAADAPNFYRLRSEGAYTDNARTDPDYTVTLPNHTSMLTGRGVTGARGHNYLANVAPSASTTLHNIREAYVSSVFDVSHDAGLRTALFASKTKFLIYEQSYNATAGAPDNTGIDNGTDKIDVVEIHRDTQELIDAFLTAMDREPCNYSFLHLRDPDSAGHGSTWDLTSDSAYLDSVRRIDGLLGRILDSIDNDERLRDRTAIILSADHGGRTGTTTHQPADNHENYRVPFYVWGPGVSRGVDLYGLNQNSRHDPGTAQASYSSAGQPIRNGDGANLALRLLDLPAVPGSTINVEQVLVTTGAASRPSRPLGVYGLLVLGIALASYSLHRYRTRPGS